MSSARVFSLPQFTEKLYKPMFRSEITFLELLRKHSIDADPERAIPVHAIIAKRTEALVRQIRRADISRIGIQIRPRRQSHRQET